MQYNDAGGKELLWLMQHNDAGGNIMMLMWFSLLRLCWEICYILFVVFLLAFVSEGIQF
jgi:hypothetical protein